MVDGWRRPTSVLLFILGLALSVDARSNRWKAGGYNEGPIHITTRPQKRDATICATSYTLCPASLSGGCCPADLSCGVSSCYPTSSAPPVQCTNFPGYIACGLDQGAGCCPSGYSCARDGCISGSTYSQSCDTGSYLCPSSLGYGCCHNNLACGVGFCYATSFSTVPVTITYTTTISNSITETITTVVQTAYSVSSAQALAISSAASPTITKFTPSATAAPKVDASSDSSPSELTQVQLGGIIGAAALVVIVVCVSTFLILRRLNALSKAEAAKKSASNSNTKSSNRPRPRGPNASGAYSGLEYIESMSVDPLMVTESESGPAHSSTGPPRPPAVYNVRTDLEPGSFPPIPAPYVSPQAYIGGYQPVPISEPHSSNSSGHFRNQSADSPNRSRSPRSGNITGYFDDSALRDQNLRHGHASPRPSVQSHGRQWSDASDFSQQSGSSGAVELEAGQDGDRRSSLQRAIQGVGFSRIASSGQSLDGRRRSSSDGTVRRSMGAAPGMSHRLENVLESELDSREKSAGPLNNEGEVPKSRTTYQSQFHEMGIPTVGPSETEVDRFEQQKVIGNLGDLRKDPR